MFSKKNRTRNKPSQTPLLQTQELARFIPPIQKKLTIGKADDQYEKEADKVADQMVNGTTDSNVQSKSLGDSVSPWVQKEENVQKQAMPEEEELQMQEMPEEEELQMKCDGCEKEESLQRKIEGSKVTKSTNFEQSLNDHKGKGSRLENGVKNEFEQAFQNDFSKVRVHNDSVADNLTKQVNAKAFTHGHDIYFRNQNFDPSSKKGKHLLAHELTHTIQQKGQQKYIQRKEDQTTSDECNSTSVRNSKNGPKATICFATNSSSLDANDKESLDELISGLNEQLTQQDVKLKVWGFADHRGDPDYNQWLSEQRANSVADYVRANIRDSSYLFEIEALGGGEIGDTEISDSWQLRNNRIVEAYIPGFDDKTRKKRGLGNLKIWLKMGIFHEAWAGDKVENGDFYLCLLENMVKEPFTITSSVYRNESIPNDLFVSERDYSNFQKEWNIEAYKRLGFDYHECSMFNLGSSKHYIAEGRKYLLSHNSSHSRMRPIVLDKSGYWSKRNGLPDLDKAHKQLTYIFERFEPVKKRASGIVIDHECDLMDQRLIAYDFMLELQNNRGTVYECFNR